MEKKEFFLNTNTKSSAFIVPDKKEANIAQPTIKSSLSLFIVNQP